MDWSRERIFWRHALLAQVAVSAIVSILTLALLLPLAGAPAGALGPWISILVYTGIPGWPLTAAVLQVVLQAAMAGQAWTVAQDLHAPEPPNDAIRRGLILSAASLSFFSATWFLLWRTSRHAEQTHTVRFMPKPVVRKQNVAWSMAFLVAMAAMSLTTLAALAAVPLFVFALAATFFVHLLATHVLRRRFANVELRDGLPPMLAPLPGLPENP